MSPGEAKVPVAGRRNVLVTSALPYVNNVPHLGNIIGCVLSADVFDATAACAATTCSTSAAPTSTSPPPRTRPSRRDAPRWRSATSIMQYTRKCTSGSTSASTTLAGHPPPSRQISANRFSTNCWTTTGSQRTQCSRFLADRFVVGSCPVEGCGNDTARGDQCDRCGRLLNSTELIDPRCKVCEGIPVVRDTDHLFLELPLLKEQLEKYIDEASATGSWSQNAVRITDAWLKEGLRPRCITRDLKWGVPVPHEKYKDKVFYVWFDAPIGYISITACYTPEWEKWWKNPENVELYQFMGKDNVPFHTVMFPSALLGTGENWTLMKNISVTEYLNYESGKFSKTKGIGVFGNDAKATNIPADVWRYYLLSNRPEASDAVFTWGGLQIKHNNELLKNLGNFIYRVLSFIAKPEGAGYGSIIPEAPNADIHPLSQSLAETVGNLIQQYIDAMDKVKLKQGLKIAMAISSEGNAYLQESQFWKLYKQDPASCATVMKTSVGVVYLLACLLEPFMPSFSKDVLQQLNLCPNEHISFADEKGERDKAKRPWDLIPSNHRIGKIVPLFTELKDDAVASFRETFAGSQAERNARANERSQ